MKETMSVKTVRTLIAAFAAALAAGVASADVTIGISLPLTGPAASIGIPMKNQFELWPKQVAGEKLNVILLDDATDPTKGVQNARRFVTEDKVDMIIGSGATPVAIAMASVAAEAQTVQLACSPAQLPPGKDPWTFRMPQSKRGDGAPDGRAHEEAGRQDGRLPRLHRRLRRRLAERVHADRRESRHQGRRRGTLRALRHQRHRRRR